MGIVAVFKENGFYKVDLSIGYQVCVHGSFTKAQEEQAYSIAGLVNSAYGMGYTQAQRDIAKRLGLGECP